MFASSQRRSLTLIGRLLFDLQQDRFHRQVASRPQAIYSIRRCDVRFQSNSVFHKTRIVGEPNDRNAQFYTALGQCQK